MTVDLNVSEFSRAFEELDGPSAADNQAERRNPMYGLRSGLNLGKVWSDGKWRGAVHAGADRYLHYQALIMVKFCQQWTFENDHVGRVATPCHHKATLRSTTHQGYPLTGGPVECYTGNESWLSCVWCVKEERLDDLIDGTPRDTEYIQLDNGQPY